MFFSTSEKSLEKNTVCVCRRRLLLFPSANLGDLVAYVAWDWDCVARRLFSPHSHRYIPFPFESTLH